jgi:hypothetical protein
MFGKNGSSSIVARKCKLVKVLFSFSTIVMIPRLALPWISLKAQSMGWNPGIVLL